MERSNSRSLGLFVGIGPVFFYITFSAPVGAATPSVYAQPAYESPVRGVLTTRKGNGTMYEIGLDDLRPWRTALPC